MPMRFIQDYNEMYFAKSLHCEKYQILNSLFFPLNMNVLFWRKISGSSVYIQLYVVWKTVCILTTSSVPFLRLQVQRILDSIRDCHYHTNKFITRKATIKKMHDNDYQN